MIYCATQFTYDRDRRRFTAEASDFGPAPFMHRVYNDAMDMGIKVRGKNSVVLFYLTTERKDAEGDVTCWEFEPNAMDSLKLNLGPVKLLIFND